MLLWKVFAESVLDQVYLLTITQLEEKRFMWCQSKVKHMGFFVKTPTYPQPKVGFDTINTNNNPTQF